MQKFPELPQRTLTTPDIFLTKNPAYIFHHFVKCGGTSLNYVLTKWFNMIYDHITGPEDLDNYIRKRYETTKISSDFCIIGHFAYEKPILIRDIRK